MNRNLLVLVAGLVGLLGGAALCGVMALGIVLMLESLGAVAVGLFNEDAGKRLSAVPTLPEVLERYRQAS